MNKTEDLTESQIAFVDSLSNFAWFVEEQTECKAKDLRWDIKDKKSIKGFSSILFACDVILKSKWGEHPITKEKYKGKPSNNLLLLPATELWEGKTNIYEGVTYKAFENWEEFCIHFTDCVVFSREYDEVITNPSFLNQIILYSALTDENQVCYTDYIQLLVLLGITSGERA